MFDVRLYDSVGSTNDEARLLAREGAAHGTVVTAREQIAGRGRQGRGWASPPGNLYLSAVLRLELPLARIAELSFVAALAVADAVDAVLPAGRLSTLKWPNDVLVDGAKIAGILIEQAERATIVGIGVNIGHHPANTPYPVTSLAACVPSPLPPPARGGGEDRQSVGEPPPLAGGGRGRGYEAPTVDAVRGHVLAALGRWLHIWRIHGFAPVRTDWLARAHPPGTMLRAHQAEGAFAGLDADGALLLDTPDGRRRIVAGEVIPQAR